jgi:hypothetical protein
MNFGNALKLLETCYIAAEPLTAVPGGGGAAWAATAQSITIAAMLTKGLLFFISAFRTKSASSIRAGTYIIAEKR